MTGCLEEQAIDYWLFGGWAVDFYAGCGRRGRTSTSTSPVWLEDVPRIVGAPHGRRLAARSAGRRGRRHRLRAWGVRLELTYLVRDGEGRIVIPLHDRLVAWPDGALAADVGELRGVRSRLVALGALRRRKASPRDDPEDAAKDRADFRQLSDLIPPPIPDTI